MGSLQKKDDELIGDVGLEPMPATEQSS